jgi:hypothetical protein
MFENLLEIIRSAIDVLYDLKQFELICHECTDKYEWTL